MADFSWPALSADYASYHTTRGNRVCHAIGIPLIMLALVRWTQVAPLAPVPWVALVLPVYFFWDLRLALGMAVLVAALSAVALYMTPASALAAFVLGWAFQAVGHAVYEKRRAAFQKNLIHLLVGPAWILSELFGFSKAKAIASLALALSVLPACAEGAPAWKRYENAARGVSFIYPDSLHATESSSGAYRVDLASAACVVATFEVVPYAGPDRIELPKRGSELVFSPDKNAWLETPLSEEEDPPPAQKSVCLTPLSLGPGVKGYGRTDAMHGWSTLVILTDRKKAFLWSNVRRKDVDYCPEDLTPLIRDVRLVDGSRFVPAKCPPPEGKQ